MAMANEEATPGGSASVSSLSLTSTTSVPVPLSISLYEFAFSIDHILETVLSSLDNQNLLKCSLVSARWKSLAMKIFGIKNQNKLTFRDYKLEYNTVGKSQRRPENALHLKDLVDFWKQQKQEQQSSLKSGTCLPTPTSCHKFDFRNGSMGDELLQEFLNTLGSEIEELSLQFQTLQFNIRPKESYLITLVRNLILTQVPNLEYLFLDLYPIIEWENDLPIMHDWHLESEFGYSTEQLSNRSFCAFKRDGSVIPADYPTIRLTDPEFKKIHSKKRRRDKIIPNTSLKVLKLGKGASAKMLEEIIVLAPNLEEVILGGDDMYMFVRPLDRLKYLKKLYLNPIPMKNLKKFEEIASMSKGGNLKLRHLAVDLRESLPWYERRRVVEVINQFLRTSWDSLETVKFFGVSFNQGIQLPPTFPNVWKLHLGNSPSLPSTGSRENLFPPASNQSCFTTLSEIFPKLQAVHLHNFQESGKILEFINSLNLEPVSTVEEVKLWNSDGQPIGPSYWQLLSDFFPNCQKY